MKETKICVIGLGYVGLPLARLFSTKYKTVGFDMNAKRCEALMAGHDATLEVSDELLQNAINNNGFVCTSDIEAIRDCNFYVVAVPTPVDENNNPDLTPLYGASTTVGKVNSGVSVARNNALKHVKGEFYMFVDSDDWLDPETCAVAYDYAKQYDAAGRDLWSCLNLFV